MLPETMARLRGLVFRPDGSVLYADDNAVYALGADDVPEVIYTPKAGKIAFFRGVDKELRLPVREQPVRLTPGELCLVKLYLDPVTGRIAASRRLRGSKARPPSCSSRATAGATQPLLRARPTE